MGQTGPDPSSPSDRPSPSQRPGFRLKTVGVIDPGSIKLYIPKALLDEGVRYAQGNVRQCRGGILLGHYGQHRGERSVEAQVHVPAERGVGDSAGFRFTKESWQDLALQQETLWPDLRVLGWYYTHLGSGVFMSPTDLESHRGGFNLPHPFALVIDPIQNTLGFFQWRGQEMVPAGFLIVEPA